MLVATVITGLVGAGLWALGPGAEPFVNASIGAAGAAAVLYGFWRARVVRRDVREAARYQAFVLTRRSLGEGGGYRCLVEVQLPSGATRRLTMHAHHRKPNGDITVALVAAGHWLRPGEDPARAAEAVVLHGFEQYGWPACWVGIGLLAAAIPFFDPVIIP